MSDRYVMALDAGSGAGRSVLVNLDRPQVISAYQEWGYIIPKGLGMMAAEFDPSEFWSILSSVSRQALAKAGIQPGQVEAVSSTSQREGIVLLDENGVELYAGPNRDYRAVIEGMQISGAFGDLLYRRSGHFPASMTGAARLAWVKTHAPQVFELVSHLQSINDWILYRLSREVACEPTNAAETSLYDIGMQQWAFDVIDELGFPREIFPSVLPAGTQIGTVSHQAAEETGLLAGTPVVVGGADTQCGLLGCATLRPNDIAAVSGTTTPVQMVTAAPATDPQQRLWGGAHLVPGMFIVESNAGGSGSVYQWYRDSFYDDAVKNAKISGQNPYDVMNSDAGNAPAGCNGVQSFIGATIFNAKTMTMPPNMIALGMSPLATSNVCCRPLVTRSLVESLAFAVKANLSQVTEVAGTKPDSIGVCGGLANSRLYLEVLANVLQLPVRVPQIKEGTAIGAAISAGIGSGAFRSFEEGVQALVRIESIVMPEERLSKQYQGFYRKWLKTFEHLVTLSNRI